MSDDDPIEVTLPKGYYQTAMGVPCAVFDYLILRLHSDGSVTWYRQETPDE